MPNLTQIYNTEGMWGSWEILKKFTIVGHVVQFFLSVYGLLANASAVLRLSTTIFYLSNRRKFDEIDRVQEEGLANAFKSAHGFNKIIVVFYCLLPNIRQQSDADSAQFNLSEDDSIMTYIMKSAPSTIAIIVFSSMAFTGLLFQIFANISDGMIAVAEQARDLQVAKAVTDFFEAGKDYSFTLKTMGDNRGDQLFKVARTMYADIISRTHTGDATNKAIIGSQIESALLSSGGGSVQGCVEELKNRSNKPAKLKEYLEEKNASGQSLNHKIWDVVKLDCKPAQLEQGNTVKFIDNNSTTIYVPISKISPELKSETKFSGYLITVTFDIPDMAMYKFRPHAPKTGSH